MRSHLRGRYLLRSPWLAAYLTATDGLLAAATALAPTSRHTGETPVRRVLLAIGGHIGDAIIATSALALVRDSLPNAQIGVMTPSWSAPLFADDTRLRWRHMVDHWQLDRGARSASEKVRRYVRTSRAAIGEMKAVDYDLAIDLYPYYPNMAGLLWRAAIPRRAGFVTGGRGSLYTTPLEWQDDRSHMAEQHARLVRRAVEGMVARPTLPYSVARPPAEHAARATVLMPSGSANVVVIHPGPGTREKDWPPALWRELATRLCASGRHVVVTGHGDAEVEVSRGIAGQLASSTNLAGQLTWPVLTEVVRRASVVVCGDTSLAHLAAATGTPHVVLYSGINPIEEWRPLAAPGVPSALLTHEVPCAPCYRGHGCATMNCVRDITVDRVLAAIDAILLSRDSFAS